MIDLLLPNRLMVRDARPVLLVAGGEAAYAGRRMRNQPAIDRNERKRPVCRADLSPIGRGASAGRQQSTRRPTAVTWAIPGRLTR